MRWGFRSKLLVVTVGLIVVALIGGDLFLGQGLERDLTRRIRSDLEVRLDLVEGAMLAHQSPPEGFERWDVLADALGKRARARVTFIAVDGKVLGDSGVELADLPAVENHAGREEVVAALDQGRGSGERRSRTVQQRLMYLAKKSESADGRSIIVRVALPLTEVDAALSRQHGLMLGGSVLALMVALLLSALTSLVFGRSLRSITGVARQIARGNLDLRIRSDTSDEIGELSSTLNQLTESLSNTMQALREEKDRLGSILEAMDEGVLVVQKEAGIVMANSAAGRMLLPNPPAAADGEEGSRRGVAGAPLEGRSLLEAVRSADLDAIVAQTLSTMAPASGEVAVDRPRPRRLLVHAAPLQQESQGVVVVLVDVTEIRLLESIRKDFVANVSHELRTPVTAVRTALETARVALEHNPRDAARFLDIAERHTERLTLLVRDLLDLSQVEAGHLLLELEPVHPADVVGETVDLFREQASRRQVRLESELPAELPAVWVDRHSLLQILTNLVENAVKYSDAGGTVIVRGRREGEHVVLDVADTGPGIPAKHLPRLFERFYRVDPGRSRERGGTGLGLSIVKHLAEAMGADVSVQSQPGRGSVFSVRLPLARGASSALPANA